MEAVRAKEVSYFSVILELKQKLKSAIFSSTDFQKRSFPLKRVWEVNFCRAFISSISLCLELAGSNLAQTLLNPSKVIWHVYFC